MLKRALAAIAILVLAALAFHDIAHAAAPGGDSCAACCLGAARVAAPAAPRVVRAELPTLAVEALPSPSEVAARAPLPVARPPPSGPTT